MIGPASTGFRSLADVLGRPQALAPIVWLLLIPLSGPIAWLFTYRSGQSEDIWEPVLGFLIAIGLKGTIFETARRLLGPRLIGRQVDAWIVVGVVFAGVVIPNVAGATINEAIFGYPMVASTVGWYITGTGQQLCLAAAVSAWSSLRADRVVINRELQYQLERSSAVQQQNIFFTQAVQDAVDSKIQPLLKSLRATIPATADSGSWLRWSDAAMSTATGPVREVSGVAARLAGLSHNEVDPDAMPKLVELRSRLPLVLRQFHLAQPVTWWSSGLLIPLGIETALYADTTIFNALTFVVLLWTPLLVFAWITKTARYRDLPAVLQWPLWFAIFVFLGFLVWPLGTWLGVPDPLPFGALQRGDQSILFALVLMMINSLINIIIVGLRLKTIDNAIERALGRMQRWQNDTQQLAEEHSREEVVSLLHGPVQGRLVALSMMSHEVSRGERDAAAARPEIDNELRQLIEMELPNIAQVSDSSDINVVDQIRPSLELVVDAWSSVVRCNLAIAPAADQMAVPAETIKRVTRVVAEGVGNAAKHGLARNCQISINLSGDQPDQRFDIEVLDDGVGISHRHRIDIPSATGIGTTLLNASTQGSWSLSQTAAGTRLFARVSIPALGASPIVLNRQILNETG